MSRREIDMKAEQALAQFLDKNLYSGLRSEGHFSSIIRETDSRRQKNGIDVSMSYRKVPIYIDEKASLYYINQNLPTFAFELTYRRHGKDWLGWFLNDQLKTTHYLLLWPNANTSELAVIQADDFTTVDALLIRKSRLKEYLEPIGLDDHTLLECTKILRQQGVIGRQSIPQDGMSLSVSDPAKYSESPVNLVINKRILLDLADAHYRITAKGFHRLTK